MKSPSLLTLGALAFALASCGSLENFNGLERIKNLKQPITGDSGFDPLSSPASRSSSSTTKRKSAVVAPTSPSYKAGQWVETSMPNATFFKRIPKGNARADKVLKVSTPLKVVSSKGTYVKVELDSGDVGYVPEIMVIERSSSSAVPSSSPIAPVPEFGSVPPPVEPRDRSSGAFAPAPEVPSMAPPVPEVPSLPSVPSLPDAPPLPSVGAPPVPDSLPVLPGGVAPPPEIPSLTPPIDVN